MLKAFFRRQLSSFTYLNITQFLGALNDNLYKLLIAYFLIQLEGPDRSQIVLATAGAIFVIPFLLFSESSGKLADRLSKRNIIIFTKGLELFVMTLGVVSFYYQSKVGAYSTLFLMASQSALFGPSKYGIVPELVAYEKISKANGLLTSFTFLAIIIGTFLASFVVEMSGRNFIVAALCCTSISLAGLITSTYIEYTPPAGSKKKFNLFFLKEIYGTLRRAHQHNCLQTAIFGSAFFLFMGAFMQLNTIPFALQNLGLTDVQGGYLFLINALGIGAGSIIAGRLSGKIVELGLVPIGCIGITISCFLLDACSESLPAIVFLMLLTGFFGGIYLIPLDTFIQVASPNTIRGQVVATTNFLGFLGVLAASAVVYIIGDVLGLLADKGFTVVGFVTLIVHTCIIYKISDYFVRFLAMIVSRLRFKMHVTGRQVISGREPSLFICNHTGWNDTLLLLGAQHRRIRFFTVEWHNEGTWLKRLHKMMRIMQVPSIEPIEDNGDLLTEIAQTLRKDVSVCVFVNDNISTKDLNTLKAQYSDLLLKTPFNLVMANIDKGEKKVELSIFSRLSQRFRTPASIVFSDIPKPL